MKHSFGTITINIAEDETTHEDTLTDLINAYAIVGFTSGWTEGELIESAKHIITEQYTQSVLNSPLQDNK